MHNPHLIFWFHLLNNYYVIFNNNCVYQRPRIDRKARFGLIVEFCIETNPILGLFFKKVFAFFLPNFMQVSAFNNLNRKTFQLRSNKVEIKKFSDCCVKEHSSYGTDKSISN